MRTLNQSYKPVRRIGGLLLLMLILSGCFKDFKEEYLFRDNVLEFDIATWESKAPGKNYPLSGPLEKGSGVYTFQVNMLGEQRDEPVSLQYRVVDSETTAQEGLHYRLKDQGQFTIDAGSSTGEISIEILDFPAESGTDTLVLELVSGGDIQVSENYKRIGLLISLMGPPSQEYPLHTQLGPESYYNSIYLDPLNPDLPQDIRERLEKAGQNLSEYADGSRSFQYLYLYFDSDHQVHVIAQYFGGGGNGLNVGAYARWTYDFLLDEQGTGRFEFVESNGNGTAQKANFAPILEEYIEKYAFKVDWVDPAVSTPVRQGVQLGGLFRTDDPASYMIGSLETLATNGSIYPLPGSPAIQTLFTDQQGEYFSTLFVDPDEPAQSPGFRTRWEEGKAHIQGLDGRTLHKMMFYFNPDFSFQDIRLVTYYYSASGGKFLGQIRFLLKMDYDGNLKPLDFVFQDGNGRVTRAPQIVDEFLMKTEFKLTRSGDRIRFTSTDDASVYFEGTLGNIPLGTSNFFPD